MSIKNKILAGISALTIALSFTACADTSWTGKINGKEIKAGVYLFYTIQGYNSAYSTLSTEGEVSDKIIFTKKIKDKDVSAYITDYADNMCKRMAAINAKFDELGLKFSETDNKTLKKTVEDEWDASGKEYTKKGIGKSSVTSIIETNLKEKLLFSKYYDKGGIEEVSQKALDDKLNEKYARVMLIPVSVQDADGKPVDDAKKAEALKKAESYVARAKSGEDFSAMFDEYYKEKYPGADSVATEVDANSKYKNEQIVYVGNNNIDPTTISEILKLPSDKQPTIVKGNNYYYVVEKLNILEREDIKESTRQVILDDLKSADFDKMAEGWYANYSIDKNTDAYSRYTPQKVMKRVLKDNSSSTSK